MRILFVFFLIAFLPLGTFATKEDTRVMELSFEESEVLLDEGKQRELTDFINDAERTGKLKEIKAITWAPANSEQEWAIAKRRVHNLKKSLESAAPTDTAVFASPWIEEIQGSIMIVFEK